MSLNINYRLTGVGWAECTLSDDQSTCTVTASYLSDALHNLVLAAHALLSRFTKLSFSFDEEPGEYQWVITSPRLNEIELQILSLGELWGDRPDSEGRRLFRTVCTPETFATAVHTAAAAVLAEHGESGYYEKWSEYPFPIAQFEQLSVALARLQA
ncbi:hypothetical protein [Variovorax terrae]|uniref:Uncharacterized protein n=1 Tax=Variovorax terrae TaxID=2923278 RepID=A0A9X1VUE4_9BURK|nr:hypothetical protein [Variovorax terrae]MCJ0763512.1 hypothetical protein [Variovorax terrae]